MSVTRREVLKLGTGAGLSLAVLPGCTPAGSDTEPFVPSLWLNIAASGAVTVHCGKFEMGQGIETAVAMLAAEELRCDWSDVTVRQAPMLSGFGSRWTAGSRSVIDCWLPLRRAGAAARQMLVEGAAQTWGVDPADCEAAAGRVRHPASGRESAYGELVAAAAARPVPENPSLASPSDWTLIGEPVPRLDTREKVDGSLEYGSDIRLPGLLMAAILHCPVFGGRPARVDDLAVRTLPGVRDVVVLADAVAVVADSYWTASRGLSKLSIDWDEGAHATVDSDVIRERLRLATEDPGALARLEGDAGGELARAAHILSAGYDLPFEAHVPMEPVSCTAHVHDDVCEIWLSSQNVFGAEAELAARQMSDIEYQLHHGVRWLFDRPIGGLKLHQTRSGGSFGRRLFHDFVVEAAEISAAVGTPVRLVWSREEDIRHDIYHPASHHRLQAALDDQGYPRAWQHRSAGPEIKAKGAAAQLPYRIPHITIESVSVDVGVSVGQWRSVHNHYNAFAVESFIDELAALGDHDPVTYRLHLLAHAPRQRAVLERAAELARWHTPAPAGRVRGVAIDAGFGSFIAMIVEVSVTGAGDIRVHDAYVAVDCGPVVNPDIASAQIEGGVAFGLTAALKSAVTLREGRVQQSNLHDHPLLRFDEMPEVHVVFVQGAAEPGGVGELGVPPVAPAVANALFRATGQRLRKIPLRLNSTNTPPEVSVRSRT